MPEDLQQCCVSIVPTNIHTLNAKRGKVGVGFRKLGKKNTARLPRHSVPVDGTTAAATLKERTSPARRPSAAQDASTTGQLVVHHEPQQTTRKCPRRCWHAWQCMFSSVLPVLPAWDVNLPAVLEVRPRAMPVPQGQHQAQ